MVVYRMELVEAGVPSLRVIIAECGWNVANRTAQAAYTVEAFAKYWVPDPAVAGVMPYMLTRGASFPLAKDWDWVAGGGKGAVYSVYDVVRNLRCASGLPPSC
jgi:hypothetical protein